MIKIFGIDISNWQSGIDLSLGKYDFCICKATEGDSHVDASLNNYVFQLTKLNKLIGFYHYARPDLNTGKGGAIAEAKHFVTTVRKSAVIGEVTLFLDWEVKDFIKEIDWVYSFMSTVKDEIGVSVGIYSSESVLKQIPALQRYPMWRAKWTGPSNMEVEPKNDTVLTTAIWQYSNKGKYPNYNGDVDLDFSGMKPFEWFRLAEQQTINNDSNSILREILEELQNIRNILEEK